MDRPAVPACSGPTQQNWGSALEKTRTARSKQQGPQAGQQQNLDRPTVPADSGSSQFDQGNAIQQPQYRSRLADFVNPPIQPAFPPGQQEPLINSGAQQLAYQPQDQVVAPPAQSYQAFQPKRSADGRFHCHEPNCTNNYADSTSLIQHARNKHSARSEPQYHCPDCDHPKQTHNPDGLVRVSPNYGTR